MNKKRSTQVIVMVENNGVMVEAKKCSFCNVVKPLDEYYKSVAGVGGRLSKCRECKRKESSEYRKENADKIKEIKAKYYKENSDHLKEYQANYVELNKDKQIEYRKKYRKENLSKRQTSRHKLRADKLFLPSDITDVEIEKLLNSRNSTDDQLDHFIPLSCGHGGSIVENMIVLDGYLNSSKGNDNPFDWAEITLGSEQYDKFMKQVKKLAKLNGLTPTEYRSFVDWCFDNKRTVEQTEQDNKRYGYRKSSLDIWKETL